MCVIIGDEVRPSVYKQTKRVIAHLSAMTLFVCRSTDNLHYEKFADGTIKCIEDEIPFEVPEGWGWGRLGELVYNHGQRRPSTDFSYIDISSIDNQHQRLSCEENILSSEKAPSRARKIVAYGDILYSTVRPYLHNMCIIDRIFSKQPIASTGFAVLTCHDDFFNEFLFYYMMSPDFDTYVNHTDNAKGVAYPSISDTRLYQALIPIPPAREQRDIVSAVKRLIPYINKYNIAREQLNRLMSNFPNAMKHSILQWAVQGKLVQQDENDEPASVLLERIRAEKEELIRQGKIKRDKRESVIYRGTDNSYYERFADGSEKCIDEEIQFDIPEHWVWCRLREITLSIRDGSHNPPPDNGSGIPLLSGVNIDNNFINIHSATRWITQSEWEIENRRTNIECGDVLLTIVGTIGRSAVVETDEHFALQRSVAVLKPCQIFSVYLMNVLQAPTTQRWFSNNGKGTAQKGIYLNMLYKLMIPIPPLQEQVKISEALNVLMDRINDIENQIA